MLGLHIVDIIVSVVYTVIFSFALMPFIMKTVGGFSGLRETVNNKNIFSLTASGGVLPLRKGDLPTT